MPVKSPAVPLEYENALSRALVFGAELLSETNGAPVAARALVNFLRGNQPLPGRRESAPIADLAACHGLLHDHSAAFLSRVLERLVEEGYLEEAGERSGRYRPSAAGKRLVKGREALAASLALRPERLGVHPRREHELRALRQRIAEEEGRPAFSIFANATLAWVASHAPHDIAGLARAPGLGERRLRKYGRRILAAIRRAGG